MSSKDLLEGISVALVLTLAACGGDDEQRGGIEGPGLTSLGGVEDDGGEQDDGDDGGETGANTGGATDGAGDGVADDGEGDEAGADGGGPAFDLPNGDGGDGVEPEAGCKRVDFLFVVDNSASMSNNQAALVGAFPTFMETIQSTLSADSDYHVLVTDTDAWGRCDTINGFNGSDPDSNLCNNYIKNTEFEECDGVWGAGVVHPAGDHASNQHCMPDGGNRYLEPGQADLGETFACMATVGVAGHGKERPMDAMVAALDPAINGAGGCNDGFLRDDALLVVTFMSDDPKWEDADGPNEWYQSVLDAKLGDPESIVVLGLTPDWDGCGSGGPPKGSHWSEFVTMFGDHGLHGNVCGTADDYVSFFEDAVSTIDQACDDYQPPA